jgi:hypothetical protein
MYLIIIWFAFVFRRFLILWDTIREITSISRIFINDTLAWRCIMKRMDFRETNLNQVKRTVVFPYVPIILKDKIWMVLKHKSINQSIWRYNQNRALASPSLFLQYFLLFLTSLKCLISINWFASFLTRLTIRSYVYPGISSLQR